MNRYKYCLSLVLLLLGIAATAADLTFWGPGYAPWAAGINVRPNGEVWIGTGYGVKVYAADGRFLRDLDRPAKGAGAIEAIAFDAQGEPIFGTRGGAVIWYLDGKPQTLAGNTGDGLHGLLVDRQGRLYVSAHGNANFIRRYRRSGNLMVLDQTFEAPKDRPFGAPFGIALDEQQRLWVSGWSKSGLWRFTPDGKFLDVVLDGQQCNQLCQGPEGIYVVTDRDTAIIDPATATIKRRFPSPAGIFGAYGFSVDAEGNCYYAHSEGGRVRKLSSQGKELAQYGAAYRATVTLPPAWTTGQPIDLPVKVEPYAQPAGAVPAPTFTVALQPARPTGDPDSNYRDSGWAAQAIPNAGKEWTAQRLKLYAAQERKLTTEANADGLRLAVPADVSTDVWRAIVRATGVAEPASGELEAPVRVAQPGAASSLGLFIPRVRTVFQHGETIELAVILRVKDQLPAGKLTFSLAPRQGEETAYQPKASFWCSVNVPAGPSRTLTFRTPAQGIMAGRYLLQVEGSFGNALLRDTWPLQIVDPTPDTRFKLMFAEWSAGYTHLWGPFTGKGMRSDSRLLADEGLNLYDADILSRASQPEVRPIVAEAPWLAASVEQAAADPAMPAAEKFLQPTPLEIELQEAVRNKLQVQRDIQGSHDLGDWGWANPLSIPRDNRRIRNWTQWQREWPSWVGHRYQTLSWAVPGEEEVIRVAVMAKGLQPPTNQELVWARNEGQRGFITDSPVGINYVVGVGADAAGDYYTAQYSMGVLTKYSPDGKLLWRVNTLHESRDLYVTPDGTSYVCAGGQFAVINPDGTRKGAFPVQAGPWSPSGITVTADGTVLLSSSDNRILRYTVDGKKLGEFGSKESLNGPGGIAVGKDGRIYVVNSGSGSMAIFDKDGNPQQVLGNHCSPVFGGKADVAVAPDGTLWTTHYAMLSHWTADGELIAHIGKSTLAPGGFSAPMTVAVLPNGNLLEGDSGRPFGQQLTPTGEPVSIFGVDRLLLDVRTDRTRYAWQDAIMVNIFAPLPKLVGQPGEHLHAFACPTSQKDVPWQPVTVEAMGGREYRLAAPKLEGKVTLRLLWAGEDISPEQMQRADLTLELAPVMSAEDRARLADIMRRQRAWEDARIGGRMRRVISFTDLTNEIRPDSQNTCPTNFGSQDFVGGGVWEPWRLPGLVAVANNPGTDAGEFPLHAPWYLADGLIGPTIKPAWGNLLSWHWSHDEHLHRPLRDVFLQLGTGASGIGTGAFIPEMSEKGLAAHRRFVGWLQRVGDASLNLELPGRGGVAVLHSFTQETMVHVDHSHFYSAMAAWGDLLRAHVPAAAISEETILTQPQTVRRYKAILLPDIRFPLPDDVVKALELYRQGGGEVWVDLACRMTVPPGWKTLKARYFPAAIENVFYVFVPGGAGAGAYEGNYEYWLWKTQSDERLPAVREAFGRFGIAPVRSDDPDVYLQARQGGAATWVFAGNDHYPDLPLHKTYLCGDAPVPATVPFTMQGVVYDALKGELVTAGKQEVRFTDEQPGMIWVAMPRPIGGLGLKVATGDGLLYATTTLLDAAGKPLPAVAPVEVIVRDPAGNIIAHLRRGTDAEGICRVNLPIRWQAADGQWTVEAKELLAGKSSRATVAVKVPAAPVLTQATEPALVFDAPAIAKWLQTNQGKEVWVPLDKSADNTLRALAEQTATGLTMLGVKAKVMDLSTLPRVQFKPGYKMTPDEQANIEKVQRNEAIGQMAPSWGYEFATNGPGTVIMRPLVLLGNPAQNSLLREIQDYRLPRRLLSPGYPGPGRALVQYVWSPFYDGSDVIIISANDQDGLKAGVAALLNQR